MEIITGNLFLRIKSIDSPLLKEFEIGLDDSVHFEYYHHWQGDQYHCISIGNTYICWKGFPYIDSK